MPANITVTQDEADTLVDLPPEKASGILRLSGTPLPPPTPKPPSPLTAHSPLPVKKQDESPNIRGPHKEDSFTSFTGSDIRAYIQFPFLPNPLPLGGLSLLSWQTQRNKSMVTSCGRATGLGYTRGVRVVTGVLMFLQEDRSPFVTLWDNHIRQVFPAYGKALYPDELPPFNLIVTFVNEEGTASVMTIFGAEVALGQGTNSTDENNPTESYSFVALDISTLRPLASRAIPSSSLNQQIKKATPMIYKERISSKQKKEVSRQINLAPKVVEKEAPPKNGITRVMGTAGVIPPQPMTDMLLGISDTSSLEEARVLLKAKQQGFNALTSDEKNTLKEYNSRKFLILGK